VVELVIHLLVVAVTRMAKCLAGFHDYFYWSSWTHSKSDDRRVCLIAGCQRLEHWNPLTREWDVPPRRQGGALVSAPEWGGL